MKKREVFLTQWSRLAGEMTEELQSQLEKYGVVNEKKISDIYRTKLLRWHSDMNPEGRWAQGLGWEENQMLLDAMEEVMLPNCSVKKDGLSKSLISGLAVGVAAGAMVSVLGGRGILFAGFVAIVVGAAVFMAVKTSEVSKWKASVSRTVSAFKQDFLQIGEDLAGRLR